MFRGWIDKSWQKWQENHIRKHFPGNETKAMQSKLWTLQLIEFMWNEGHTLWKERCDATHQKNTRLDSARRRELIEGKVTTMYEKELQVGHVDRGKIFAKSLEEKLLETARQLEKWHQTMTPALHQAIYDNNKRIREHMKDIRTFFEPRQTNNKKKKKKEKHTTTTRTTREQTKNLKRQRIQITRYNDSSEDEKPQQQDESEDSDSSTEIPKVKYQQRIKFTMKGTPPKIKRRTARIAVTRKRNKSNQQKITNSMTSTTSNANHPI
jgi:hypothetical protein